MAIAKLRKEAITDAKTARRLLELASRYVHQAQGVIDDVKSEFFSDKAFIRAAESNAAAAKRWVTEALALLPPASAPPEAFTTYHRDKTWAAFNTAAASMNDISRLANDKTNWTDDLQKAAGQVVGSTTQAVGAVLGTAADLAGNAAGGLLGGVFKNLGWGAIVLGGVIGVALVVRKKVGVII